MAVTKTILALSLVLLPFVAAQTLPTEAQVKALFTTWNNALATLDPEAVADLYAPDGVLLPTVSNKVRNTRAEIVDYFTMFLKKKPQGVIDESYVNIMGPTVAAHYGIYTFTLTDEATGVSSKVQARFSYTYELIGGDWLIVEHHSSAMPEQALPTEDQVKDLFNQWNDALATLDPETVADMYAPNAVLLPTVSNNVCTSRDEIVDYFVMFLKKKPQGVINESYVEIFSSTMAAHYGIYTFALTDDATGKVSKVGARFSYTYTKVGDKWLIVEHHSSVLPEQPMPTEDQVKDLFNQWNAALATLDPVKVADMYAPDAVLLPTVSDNVRSSREEILDYFVMFLKKKPQGVIDESYVNIMGPTLAAHYGIYTFALTDDATGKVSNVGARFSYTYRKDGDKWLIVEHHSSVLPEASAKASSAPAAAAAHDAATQDDVREVVMGVGLGVGLGVGVTIMAMLVYVIAAIKKLQQQYVPSAAEVTVVTSNADKV